VNGLTVVFPNRVICVFQTASQEFKDSRINKVMETVDLRISSMAIWSPSVTLCMIYERGLLPVSAPWPSRIAFTASGSVKTMIVLFKILICKRKVVRILLYYSGGWYATDGNDWAIRICPFCKSGAFKNNEHLLEIE
jgi:hypothetical protein